MKKTSLGSLSLLVLSFIFVFGGMKDVHSAGYLNAEKGVVYPTQSECGGGCKPYQTSSEIAAEKAKGAVYQQQIKDINAGKYDEAIAAGKTPAEASAAAGGYDPATQTTGAGEYNGYTPGGDNTNIQTNGAAAPEDMSTDNILGVPTSDLRKGNVDQSTLPLVIVNVIETLLAVAGTVAIFSLIYHAVQMQINSGITGDSSGVDKAKKGMIGSVIGFIIAILAWFIVTRAVELLGAVT